MSINEKIDQAFIDSVIETMTNCTMENIAEWKYKDMGDHRPTNYNVLNLGEVHKMLQKLKVEIKELIKLENQTK